MLASLNELQVKRDVSRVFSQKRISDVNSIVIDEQWAGNDNEYEASGNISAAWLQSSFD